MLNIFYGRESQDKDVFIYENISENAILIVPDQYTLEAEKDILRNTSLKGLLDIEVLGFSRLSDRILDECGKAPQKPINKYGRYMLLLKILKDINGELDIYSDMYLKPSFIEMLNNLIAQIRQNNLDSFGLSQIKDKIHDGTLLKRKLSDICLIYEKYEEAVDGKYIDTEEAVSFVISKISESSYIREKEIWITGFDSFTPKNMDFIFELINNAPSVNIVLSYDTGSRDEHLFSLTGSVISELKKRTEGKLSISKIEGYKADKKEGIAFLEKELYAFPPSKASSFEGISIVRATSLFSEIETAASYITALVRDEGYRYSDIAVICNDLENMAPSIKRVFRKYNLPLFLDENRRVIGTSLSIFFLSYLSMGIKGINTSDVFKMLRSGYIQYDDDRIDELENYIIEYRIVKRGWNKPFVKIGQNGEEGLLRCEEMRKEICENVSSFSKELKSSEDVHSMLQAILKYFLCDEKVTSSVRERTDFMSQNGYAEEAQLAISSWNAIADTVEQLNEVLGKESLPAERVFEILSLGLGETEAGVLPPVCDSISLGTAQRSRIARAKAVLVIGADEGVFPSGSGEEMLLNSDELERLEDDFNISVAKTEKIRLCEEALGIYRTLSKASEKVWIGTASSNESGEEVKPSPVISTLTDIFPALNIEEDIYSAKNYLAQVSSSEAASENLIRAIRNTAQNSSLDRVFRETLNWYKTNSSQEFKTMEAGLKYSPKKKNLDLKLTHKLYEKSDEKFSFSPSELETFAKCPFEHFIKYGMRPQERRVYEMQAREIGDVYHEIFMKLSDWLTDKDIPLTDPDSLWMTISNEEFIKHSSDIINEVLTSYKDGLFINGKAEVFRSEKLMKTAQSIFWIIIRQVRAGDIKEAAFEERFGRNSRIPAIVVKTETDRVYIEGIIDRIDILGNDQVKIIDYKTGSASFSEKEAVSGWKLQLIIYLKAGLNYKDNLTPAGTFYFHVKDTAVDMSGGSLTPESLENEIFKSFKLDGAVLNDPDTIRSIAGEFTGHSPIIPVKVSKDNNFSPSSKKVMSENDFNTLLGKVDNTINDLCERIVSGDIELKPKFLLNSKTTACHYCDFESICGFDPEFDDLKYSYI